MRDEFPPKSKQILASRVGWRCSNPSCRAFTTGPNQHREKSVNVGVAAHITAASPKGPRYDPMLSSNERRSIENGIWLCANCARRIDSDKKRFSSHVLHLWKVDSEMLAYNELGQPQAPNRNLQPIRFSVIRVSNNCL